MNQLDTLHRINSLVARFVAEVKGARALGHTDLNRVAEDVLVPLFRVVYGYRDLRNLNSDDRRDYPAVDLGDDTLGIAIQVTGTSDSSKMKSTLEKFVNHSLHERFKHVRIYVLTEKQKAYAGSGWDDIVGQRFRFDKDQDIFDFQDLIAAIGLLPLPELNQVENILEGAFGDGRPPLFGADHVAQTEPVFVNLLEIWFPERLFVARLSSDGLSTTVSAHQHQRRGRRRSAKGASEGARLSDYLRTHYEKYPRDWVCHSGQIITFQDLGDESNPLRSAIEIDSVEEIETREFYGYDANQERVFKFLLDKCLGERLYLKHVVWQPEDRC